MTVGEIITLFNIHKIMSGECEEHRELTIDDVIPF